jgi:hypothetical protein
MTRLWALGLLGAGLAVLLTAPAGGPGGTSLHFLGGLLLGFSLTALIRRGTRRRSCVLCGASLDPGRYDTRCPVCRGGAPGPGLRP